MDICNERESMTPNRPACFKPDIQGSLSSLKAPNPKRAFEIVH